MQAYKCILQNQQQLQQQSMSMPIHKHSVNILSLLSVLRHCPGERSERTESPEEKTDGRLA